MAVAEEIQHFVLFLGIPLLKFTGYSNMIMCLSIITTVACQVTILSPNQWTAVSLLGFYRSS